MPSSRLRARGLDALWTRHRHVLQQLCYLVDQSIAHFEGRLLYVMGDMLFPIQIIWKSLRKDPKYIRYNNSRGWRRTKSLCLHKVNHPLHVDAHFDDTSSTCLLFVGPSFPSTSKISLRVPNQQDDDDADIVDSAPVASGPRSDFFHTGECDGKKGD